MNREINILIADDHEVWRKGMIQILQSIEGINVMAEAENGVELLQICKASKPELVITDILMPGMDGSLAIKEMINLPVPPVIIAMSMIEEEMEVYDVLACGAQGYLVKNAKRHEIKEAIEVVMNTNRYYCGLKNNYLENILKETTYPGLPLQNKRFTGREMDVMLAIGKQLTSEEIGQQLFISPQTVNGHRNNLIKKTGSKNVIGVLIYAIKNRLINLR